MIHENSPDIRIRRVVDLVVGKFAFHHPPIVDYDDVKHCTNQMLTSLFIGRVRTSLVIPPPGESSPHTVSLNVLSPQVQSHPDENKSVFRFDAAWDSSLHNSILLNRYRFLRLLSKKQDYFGDFTLLSCLLEVKSGVCCFVGWLHQENLCLLPWQRTLRLVYNFLFCVFRTD